mgnify:CR=1 FL=1
MDLVVRDDVQVEAARRLVAAHTPSGSVDEVEVRPSTRTVLAPIIGGIERLGRLIADLDEESIDVSDIGLRRPTLDDVFLTLTGRDTSGDESASLEEVAS